MSKKLSPVASVCALVSVLGLTAVPASAHAEGFFDQLFGLTPQPAPQAAPVPSYGYDGSGYVQDAPVHHRPKRKVVVVDTKPKLQKPTDLMHDATLQTGDAVMMKDGLHVYTGDDRGAKHTRADFELLDAVRGMPKQERRALVAMDTTRNDPLRDALKPDTIASGRSAAVASPVVSGTEIVDARGNKMRYVGP